MTAAGAVLADLRACGVRAFPRDGRLRLEPLASLTPELVERARGVRDELLAILAGAHALRVEVDAVEPLTAPIARNAWTTVCDPAKAIAADLASLERVVGVLAEARRTGDHRAADIEGDVAELIERLEACGAAVRVVQVAP